MFYVNNLDVRQSRQTNDSASIVKRAKERFCRSEMLKKAQQETKSKRRDYRGFYNCGVLIWPPAALSLAFRYGKIFLWRALQY